MNELLSKQRDYYNTNVTKNIDFRVAMLDLLDKAIENNLNDIFEALNKDLNKSAQEAYLTEVLLVKDEIKKIKKEIYKFNKKRKKKLIF